MNAQVLVVGAINVDLVVSAPRLPRPGETVVGPGVARSGGGKGANAAVAAAAAGAITAMIGAVGDDDSGRFALDDLARRGVDVSSVQVLDGHATGTALIVVDAAGENQIAVGLGATGVLDAGSVAAAVSGRADHDGVVLVSAELPDETILAAVDAALRSGSTCVLNPAPVVPGAVRAVRPGVLLTPNEGELAELAAALGLQTTDVSRRAVGLAARTGAPVVVTLGSRGALVVDTAGGDPPDPVGIAATDVTDVVDTTGAGDCVNGTFAAALASGARVQDAARQAVAAASRSVRWAGARPPVS